MKIFLIFITVSLVASQALWNLYMLVTPTMPFSFNVMLALIGFVGGFYVWAGYLIGEII